MRFHRFTQFILDEAVAGDYLRLSRFGTPKFETHTTTQYASYKIVWDEINWPDFWKDTGGMTATTLTTIGIAVSSEALVVIGITSGAVLGVIEVVDVIAKDLWPIAQEIRRGNEPTSEQIRQFNEAIRYISEQKIEEAFEAVSRLQIPIFGIKGLWENITGAIYYIP